MCTLYIPPTDEERKARIEALRNITPQEIERLRASVRWKVPREMIDDALSFALTIAVQRYNGDGKLKNYILKTAWHYANHQLRKHRRCKTFSDLQGDEENIEYIDRFLPSTPAYEIHELDRRWLQTVHQRIDSMYVRGGIRRYAPSTIRRAHTALDVLVTSCENGEGIGMEEWMDGTRRGHGYHRKTIHSNKQVQGEIVKHFASLMTTDPGSARKAYKLVKESTAQELDAKGRK
ncbi:hypothetical protein ARNL5_00238 [Anaerolineae bacterium]|nr:hypothetical protein ARNL5_00238 [Anaerolineae bacterium]